MRIISEKNSTLFSDFGACKLTKYCISNISLLLYVMGVIQVLLVKYIFDFSLALFATQTLAFSIIYWLSVRRYDMNFRFGLSAHFWLVAIIGGLGMLVGHIIFGDAGHAHHSGNQTIVSSGTLLLVYRSVFGGMTLVMLAVCIPSCVFLCRQYTVHKTWGETFVLHSVCSASMVLGMCLAPLSIGWIFVEKHVVIEHYLMCVLMAMFSAVAYCQILKYQSLR
ncbi:MAG: hypothetical protein ACN4GM_00775 [Gammaproteobacteria bacterium]